jgi:hypothetical protein
LAAMIAREGVTELLDAMQKQRVLVVGDALEDLRYLLVRLITRADAVLLEDYNVVDPKYKHFFNYQGATVFFDYFSEDHQLAFCSTARFRIRQRRLYFQGALLGRLLFHFARLFPAFYETRLAWIFPAWFMFFELEAVK